MPFLPCCKYMSNVRSPAHVLWFAIKERSQDSSLWAAVLFVPWDHNDSVRWLDVQSRKLFLKLCFYTQSPPIFMDWYNSDFIAVQPPTLCELFLSIPVWCAVKYKHSRTLAVPKPSYFAYSSSLQTRSLADDFLCNVPIVEHSALKFCFFLPTVVDLRLPPVSLTIHVCGRLKTVKWTWFVSCSFGCVSL